MGNNKRSGAESKRRPPIERLMICEEVAQALGCSKQGVSFIEARALRKIREGLKARGYDDEVVDIPAWIAAYLLGIF